MSNFKKRKDAEAAEAAEAAALAPPVVQEPVYTQSGFDVFTPDGGRTYQVAEIAYNHLTGEAKVTEIFDLSRLVGMSYINHKASLNSLKKTAKRKQGGK